MSNAFYETIKEIGPSGITLSYHTVPGGYHPLHWHEELELLYPLNGETDINIEGKKYKLPRKNLIAIDAYEVHSSFSHHTPGMFLCIHISKKQMQQYMPEIELYHIHCIPEEISDADFPHYRRICQLLEDLTRIYIEDAVAFQLEANGIILQALAHLIRHFATNTAPLLTASDALAQKRLRQIITYVQENFREPLTLSDVSEQLGLGKEYFCRFFKKNMGLSFFNYLNEVRLTHVYQDLINTDEPIADIMAKNGFANQKLFNRSFKEMYGCTPSAVRKPVLEKPD